jgi:pyruvate kinase
MDFPTVRAKIVCTLGPATDSPDKVMIELSMRA